MEISNIIHIPGKGYKWHSVFFNERKDLEKVLLFNSASVLHTPVDQLTISEKDGTWNITRVIPIEQAYLENEQKFPLGVSNA